MMPDRDVPDLSNQSGVRIVQRPKQQNYSSRNSLRSAQAVVAKNISKGKGSNASSLTNVNTNNNMPAKAQERRSNGIELFERPGDYDMLNSDCFLRACQEDLICMLCGTRDRVRGESLKQAIEKHLASDSHNYLYYQLKSFLWKKTPAESSLQMEAIRELTAKWYSNNVTTKDEVEYHLAPIIDEFEALVSQVDRDCVCRTLGSFKTGTLLKSSDINLELVHPSSEIFESDPRAKNSIHHILIDPDAELGSQFNRHATYFDLIPNAIDTLHTIMMTVQNICGHHGLAGSSFEVLSGLDDLNGKVPKLILRHMASQKRLEVGCYIASSFKLAALLETYLSLDERARELVILVKYWAKICRIDNPDLGTLPPSAFLILVIYYLQRVSPPILPCLHELLAKGSKADESIDSTAEQLKKMSLRNDSNCDPTLPDDHPDSNGTNEHSEIPTDNAEDLDDDEEENSQNPEFNREEVMKLNWVSNNSSPVHELFVDFLCSMIDEFDHVPNVISIRTSKKVSLATKNWGTQIKAIENPIKPRINLSRCIATLRTFDYVKKCFRHGYYYLTSLPLDFNLRPKTENHQDPRDHIELYVNTKKLESYYRMKGGNIRNECKYDPITEMINQNLFARDVEVISSLSRTSPRDVSLLPGTVANFYLENLLVPYDVASTTYCWLCRNIGHSRINCPKSRIENLQREFELYDMNLDFNANLDFGLVKLFKQDRISQKLAEKHMRVVQELENIIREGTGLACELRLFGSTVNNLGSFDSDLDICMTLKNHPTGKGIDCKDVLGKVYEVLMKHEAKVSSIELILATRVPIIKFEYEKFDVDLSMYNQCATHNSKLLRTYSEIDNRVANLFYLVKRYAKACGIADASRGSLSSYAWSLMTIHYLQQTSPPILPVLQESLNGEDVPKIGVNGWNVWFNSDIKSYKMQENKLNLTQLFKGFLLYYGTFDFNIYTVSIRKSNLITRFKKSWNNCMMAIEDPFELTYNLASRLDDPMAIYIINSFSQAYRHIVRVQRDHLAQKNPVVHRTAFKIFNGREITGCSPPYRGCRICHRIGHWVKECPEKRRAKNNHDQSKFPKGPR